MVETLFKPEVMHQHLGMILLRSCYGQNSHCLLYSLFKSDVNYLPKIQILYLFGR